jgi:hypothetical protein
MKKVLTERRLCELAGIDEADTLQLHKSKRDTKKRAQHAAEKEFFGSEVDPLVTTDVPQVPSADPNATQPLTPAQLDRIQKDVPPESRRPIALQLYRSLIEPKYSQDDIEVMVHNDEDVADTLAQLIGWFHPAFEDSRGRPTYDNPSRLGVQVAQEFEKEGRDIIDDAQEFSRRMEKYGYAEAKAEFAKTIAHRDAQPRHPDYERPPSRMQTPGTPEYKEFQQLRQKLGAPSDSAPGHTVRRIKK